MIPYHGTPISGVREDVSRFLRGRHALVPYPRPDDVGVVAEVCQSFVFDNGAFSIWKKGGRLDVAGYVAWVEQWHRHPRFDWALIPDVIDGDEAENDALLANWPRQLRGVPVWHMHESFDRLERLCHAWSVVALGSSGQWAVPGTAPWWQRMNAAMDAICDDNGRPPCRLHGLRMLNPQVFTQLPLSSADSANAGTNCNNHSQWARSPYKPATAGQRAQVIADRVEIHNSAAVFDRAAWMLS